MVQGNPKDVLKAAFELKRNGDVDSNHYVNIGDKRFKLRQVSQSTRILPLQQRKAFKLSIIKGLSSVEVAKIMGISQPNAVKYSGIALEKILKYLREK